MNSQVKVTKSRKWIKQLRYGLVVGAVPYSVVSLCGVFADATFAQTLTQARTSSSAQTEELATVFPDLTNQVAGAAQNEGSLLKLASMVSASTSNGLTERASVSLPTQSSGSLLKLADIVSTSTLASAVTSNTIYSADSLKPVVIDSTSVIEPQPALIVAQSAEAPAESNAQFSPRIGARYTHRGAGYLEGYTSLEGFVPIFQNFPESGLGFFEGRVFLQNNSSVGGNAVFGYRHYDATRDNVWGGYLAYDHRSTGTNSFNQIGAGFEFLSELFDFRVNGYLPVGTTRYQVSSTIGGLSFSGNNLLINSTQRFESAASGIDAEIGREIAPIGDTGSLRAYAGIYYLSAQGSSSVVGVKGRLEVRPTDFLDLGLSIQNDALFDTRLVFTVGASFPGSSPTNREAVSRVFARVGENTGRQAAIIVADPTVSGQTQNTSQVAINAATGQAYRLLHVTSGANGNGTVENPFGTIQAALASASSNTRDLIYVAGSGNETTNPNTLTIPTNVSIFSNNAQRQTPDVIQQLGTRATLPVSPIGLNTGAVYNLVSFLTLSGNNQIGGITVTDPVVVNPPANQTITITGNNATLNGVTVNSPNGPGIQATGVSNLTLTNNTVNTPQGRGIELINVTGNVNLTGNTVNGPTGGFPDSGIFLDNSSGNVNLTFTNNTVTGTSNHGLNVNLSGTAIGTGTISGNTISGNVGSGILIQGAGTSSGTFTITNNQIFNNTAAGVDVNTTGSAQLRVTVSSNPRLNGNSLAGVRFQTFSATSQIFGQVQGNTTLTGNTGPDVQAQTFLPGTICLRLNNNTIGTLNLNNLGTGTIQVEGALPGTNTITTPNVTGTTTVANGTCGF